MPSKFTSKISTVAVVVSLAACSQAPTREMVVEQKTVPPTTIARIQTPLGLGELRHYMNVYDGGYQIDFPSHASIMLPSIRDAQFVGSRIVDGITMLIISGHNPSSGCPYMYDVIAMQYQSYTVNQLGNCNDQLDFTTNNNALIASQHGASDPLFWSIKGFSVTGPFRFSAISGENLQNTPRQQPAVSGSTGTSSTPQQMPAKPKKKIESVDLDAVLAR